MFRERLSGNLTIEGDSKYTDSWDMKESDKERQLEKIMKGIQATTPAMTVSFPHVYRRVGEVTSSLAKQGFERKLMVIE